MREATSTWNRVTGDIKDTITAKLNGINDLLNAVSGEAHIWACDGGATVTAPVTITDAANSIVRADLSSWLPTAVPGPYDLEWEITFGDGSQWTWPSLGRDRINIRQQGA